jgi:hypothetical protein
MDHTATRRLLPALAVLLSGMATGVEPAATAAAPKTATSQATPKAAPAAPAPSQAEQDRTLYALGVLLSRGLDSFQLSDAEFDVELFDVVAAPTAAPAPQ